MDADVTGTTATVPTSERTNGAALERGPGIATQTPLPPHAQLIQIGLSNWTSRAIYAAAALNIADRLADGPCDVDALAQITGTYAPALRRLLRALASMGVLQSDAEGRYALTPLGEALQSDAPGAARSTVLALSGDWWWKAWGEILHSLRTGGTGMVHAHGMSLYTYLVQNAEDASHFNTAMIGFHVDEPAAVAEAYDFSGIRTLVDVGGGSGNLLLTLLRANPHLNGVLFDRPHVAREAQQNAVAAALSDRCVVVGGDFFESVPAGGDAYVISHCIHNWSEDGCVKLLENCRRAMGPAGRLLIVEAVLRLGDEPDPAKILDLAMLVIPGGEERTEEEYRALLARAGFRLTRVVPTTTSASVIEAVPV
jgi:SAM-dependent methyltransferase